jgi:hypothetical protein
MAADRTAYRILGLRPGASRAEVNDAYRRLMMRYHPDRPGGDPDRAAEINRAYSFLRRRLGEPVRVPVVVPIRRRAGPTRHRRAAWLVALLAVVALGAVVGRDSGRLSRNGFVIIPQWSTAADSNDVVSVDLRSASFDEPVQPHIVDKAITDAIRFHSSGDLAGASAYSSDCQKSLRRQRNLGWFDACAAFDEAMLTLNGDREQPASSPFNEAAVVTREVAAARILSDDSLGADSHLHEIRSQVDFAILPMLDSAAAEKP